MYHDIQYAKIVSTRLQHFKEKSKYHYEFRCPVCGDSKKNPYKTRGTLFPNQHRTGLRFGCFNCKASMSFRNFLKYLDYSIYKDWLFSKWQDEKDLESGLVDDLDNSSGRSERAVSIFDDLSVLASLSEDHHARVYLSERHIPERFLSEFYYTDNFSVWSNQFYDEDDHLTEYMSEPRLVFPLITDSGIEFGYQGRVLFETSARERYMTKMLDKRFTKVWGMNLVNRNEDIVVLEGVLDAVAFPNAIAALDSDLSGTAEKLRLPPESTIIVHDNEIYNTEICHSIETSIDRGYQVAFWPSWAKQYGKDVNSVIMKTGSNKIVDELQTNVYRGLSAKLVLGRQKHG